MAEEVGKEPKVEAAPKAPKAPEKYRLKQTVFMNNKLIHDGFFAKEDIPEEFYKFFIGLEKEAKEVQEKLDKDKWEARGRLVGIEIDKRKKLTEIIAEVKAATIKSRIEAGMI